MISRLKRSVLAMPGSNARALEKGKTLAADVLMFELEDGVAESAKATARAQVAAAVAGGGYGARQLVVRINARGSEWYKSDIAAIAPLGPDGIVIPKVSSRDEILKEDADLVAAGATYKTRLWAMIETPRAVLDIEKIASAADDRASRLEVLVLGPNDIAKSTRARLTPGRPALLSWLSAGVPGGSTTRDHRRDYNDLTISTAFVARRAGARLRLRRQNAHSSRPIDLGE
jgi:citrate lyase subunit beta/citryl-CoA lyase